jgi:hypothetical protein
LDSFAKTDFTTCEGEGDGPDQGAMQYSCTGQYMYNGVLTFQRLIGDFILEDTGAKAAGYYVAESGVQFVQFPTQAYEENGFFADIGGMFVGSSAGFVRPPFNVLLTPFFFRSY